MITYAIPVLAMPQPPESLEPALETGCAQPGIEMALALPAVEVISVGAESPAEKLLVPDRALPREQNPFHGIIVQVAGRYEVDPSLIRAIIFAESGYNPRAKSKKGARGLMQLMPSTAKSLGVEDIYDPEENIDGGVRYFRSLLDRFDGDVQLALAAYNAGSRHVRNYEGIPPFKATRRYIKKVLKFHEKFKMQKTARSRRLA
ncbi:MAG: lytic transglycosylase domain-containing protein [Deltaproteobacteria bacterium]|nr:lytic transglycosylase domain-containing protein [Deltaproteobacteria bacterium]